MNLRNTIPVCAAALLGFLLGAMFVRESPVKAQSRVKVAYKEMISPYTGTDVPSSQIVGFSCARHGSDNALMECYVAYIIQ